MRLWGGGKDEAGQTGLCLVDEAIYECGSVPVRAVRQPDGVFECRSGCSCRGIAGPTPSSAGKRAMVTGGLREELSEIWVYVGMHSYFEHQSTSLCFLGFHVKGEQYQATI